MIAQHSLGEEGEPHRKTRRQSRPSQRRARPPQLILAFRADRLIDHMRARRAPALAFLLRFAIGIFVHGWLEGRTSSRQAHSPGKNAPLLACAGLTGSLRLTVR